MVFKENVSPLFRRQATTSTTNDGRKIFISFYLINSSQLPMWIRRFDNRPSTNNGVSTFRELGFLECHAKFGVLF